MRKLESIQEHTIDVNLINVDQLIGSFKQNFAGHDAKQKNAKRGYEFFESNNAPMAASCFCQGAEAGEIDSLYNLAEVLRRQKND